ncbi:AGE family epimerase/isomerase [Candidatus Vallotia cooleyia]|uniref:AGE family epimerase/isomerase n=1 Tax=Candidatus Vallotiella adelgis TaxID=1177211 RepID=UPI001D00A1A2|nr:AGE family epimerase/isomerase [Candidatus Vallotia cooleyia]UDG82630.1 N-acylglucosamine 2-epimerase [Candidatus Vallotia cooleyia]
MNQLHYPSVIIDNLQKHLTNIILPLWSTRGFNNILGLPYDAIASPGQPPLPTTRYRAIGCARQLYVFSSAGWHDHADRLFESLCSRFMDTKYGGWHYSINSQGEPKETQKDLYTHAFIVFSCAEYFRHQRNLDALNLLEDTLHVIQTRFSTNSGLYNAVLSADFMTIIKGPQQNPIMHLTEAYLSARDVKPDIWFFDTLRHIAEAVTATFVHRTTGCIAELPIGCGRLRIEPGHQFEWFYLTSCAQDVFGHSDLSRWLDSAYTFSFRHGVSPITGGVCTALDEHGYVTEPTERLWAQTEFARALATLQALHGTSKALDTHISLKTQLNHFKQRFLRNYGWIEAISQNSSAVRVDMPSTTPYHIATMYHAVSRLCTKL